MHSVAFCAESSIFDKKCLSYCWKLLALKSIFNVHFVTNNSKILVFQWLSFSG
jgi:hypothetical protein